MKRTYLFAAVAIFFWSTVATVSKLLLGAMDKFQILCISAKFAAAALLAVTLSKGASWNITPVAFAGFAWNGVCCMALASTSWALALKNGNTAKVSNLAYITPFLSLVWVAVFLKEMPTVWSVAGLCLIVLGIFVQLKDKK